MVHKGPPDRIGGASKLDHNKGSAGYGAQNPKAASGRRNQKQSSPHQLQDAGNKPMVPAAASAAAAAAADLKKKMLKKARSIERISKVDLESHLGHKQVEQLSTPSPRKSKRRKNPGLLKPSPAAKTPAATMSSAPAAPNYMKATTSSDARIGRQQTQPHQQVSKARSTSSTPAAAGKKNHPTATPKTPSKTPPPSVPGNTNKASKTTLLLSRKPSLKLVIPVTKHHLAAPLFDDVNVSKATCSSTLKDSKFPDELELNPGGTQVEGTSVVRVCPYTYCSLNGHWHAPAVPLKRFLLAKRRAIKAQKSSRVRRSPSPRKRVVLVRGAAQEIATQNCSAQPTVMDLGGQNDDYFLDIYVASRGDNDDDEGRFRPTEEASATLHSHIQLQNVNPGHNGSYTEMNLQDDDNVDRLSDISLSQMGGTTACFLDHAIECPGQEGTPDDAHRHDASPMEACDEPKPDGGTLLMPGFGDFDFTRRKPIQEYQPSRSLTSSEVVEVDWEQEMPEYEDDAAGEDDEHDQRTAGTEDDAARQNGEKPSTTTQPPEGNGDQDVPDSSLSMNQVYFNLLFPGTAKSGSKEAENPTEEPTDESLEDDVNNREDGGNVSASVDALASYITATCVDNLGNDWGSIGETTVESHDGVFLTETRADNQDIPETNQQVADEIHEIGFDILTADIQGENHDTVEGNQEPHESAEDTVSESHEMINIDGFLLIGMQIDKHGQTESSPETQKNTEEVAITATVPQPDFTDQDEQTSTKVQQRGIKEPSSDEAETAKLKRVTTEVGGSEAIVEDTVVAEEEDNDMDNQVAEENGIATPPEKYLRETRLRCPKEAPATVPRDAAKRGQPLPDLDNELIRVDITRRDREEDMDEQMKGFNPRGPNFLPLEPDPEGEKVDLKHQMIDDRKNSEEWMIDHALQRAVNKLAPARKKKVALLVEAFETVAPPLPMYKAPLRTRSLGIAHAWPMQACS